MRLPLLIGALALAGSLDTASAKCARMSIVPKPITAANTAVAPGAGVLVGLTYGKYDGPDDRTVEQKSWRFKQGGKLAEPTIRVIAPGLAVYEFAGDQGTLVDDKQKALITVKRGPAGAALPTPSLKSAIGVTEGDEDRWGPSTRLSLELDAVPAGVAGVIVYSGKRPINWSAVDAKTKAITLTSGGHCSNDLPGTSVPDTGDVSVAWFDSTGRVSTPSKPIAIKKK